jgi:Tol biopolymer transport system component
VISAKRDPKSVWFSSERASIAPLSRGWGSLRVLAPVCFVCLFLQSAAPDAGFGRPVTNHATGSLVDRGVLVYASSDPDDILAANVDGSGGKDLTPGTGSSSDPLDTNPSVSPDGTKIAFERIDVSSPANEVDVMNSDGTGLHRVGVPNAFHPVWAPDSHRLAYSKPFGDDLHVVNDDGTNDRVVTSHLARFGYAWSPDGRRIAYGAEAGLEVVSVVDGSISILATVPEAWRPAWSPDGTRIAFLDDADLYIVNNDGSRLSTFVDMGHQSETPNWSPDSAHLVVGADPKLTAEQVYVMEPEEHSAVALTRSPRGQASGSPVWSPDGTRIAYLRERFGDYSADVWVMNSNGSDQSAVTTAFPTGASAGDPQWIRSSGRVEPDEARIVTTPARPTRSHRDPWLVDELDADAAHALFAVRAPASSSRGFTRIQLWSSSSGASFPVITGPCPVSSTQPAIAGTRLAFVCGSPGNAKSRIQTATTTARRPVSVGGPYQYWSVVELGRAGAQLTFANGRNVWKIIGSRAKLVRRISDLRFVRSDAALIAVLAKDRTCWFLRPNGSVVRHYRVPSDPIDDFVFAGKTLVTLTKGTLQIYDAETGRLRRSWPVGRGGQRRTLEDIRADVLVYVSGIALHVMKITTGQDIVLGFANEAGPVHARLTAKGLVYSYNEAYARRPGVVGFVPWATLDTFF